MSELNPTTLSHLKKVSVATLCTQLFKRGFRNVFIQGTQRLTTPSGGNLVGPAFTMRSIPAREVSIRFPPSTTLITHSARVSKAFRTVMYWCSTVAVKSGSLRADKFSRRG